MLRISERMDVLFHVQLARIIVASKGATEEVDSF